MSTITANGKRMGRPPGAANRLALQARQKAQETGELPHEFLLRLARGELISTKIIDPLTGQVTEVFDAPSLEMRVEAAKACAPYFAPKLQAVEILGRTIGGATDDQLDQLIEDAARAAGVALSVTGEGEEEDDPPPAARRAKLASHIKHNLART